MIYLVLGFTALATALLTLFSGFGLGTLLMPAFALFFPLPVAIASTAVVHGANNFLKVSLLYKHINKPVLFKFGSAALISSVFGAMLLAYLSNVSMNVSWSIVDWSFNTTLIKLVLGLLILLFAFFDLSPLKKKYQFSQEWLPLGGVLSGFFGGLSGHQGAFRSMFLLNCNLTPKEFVATQSVIASLVDATRLLVYLVSFIGVAGNSSSVGEIDFYLISFATLCAFVGTFVGKKLLDKTKISVVRWVTATLLLIVGSGLVTGVI